MRDCTARHGYSKPAATKEKDWHMVAQSTGRGKIFILHWNIRIGRFLEGVLRKGFFVYVSSDPEDAVSRLEENPPDLVLCHPDCLTPGIRESVRALAGEISLGLPVILVTDDPVHAPVCPERMPGAVVDCIGRSIPPSLLKWKVTKWVELKREVSQLRDSKIRAQESLSRLECRTQMLLHDFKSPLIAIRGFVNRLSRLLSSLPEDPQREATIHSLEKVCLSLEDFVADSRRTLVKGPTPADYEPIGLGQLAREVIQQHQEDLEEQGISVRLQATGSGGMVLGRKQRLRQALDNLVINAINHMNNRVDPAIEVRIVDNGQFVLASVSDNGVGVAPEFQQRIYEPYFRVLPRENGDGSGLGLSIVKEIVEAHRGKVWVESEPGKGCTFCFCLPTLASQVGHSGGPEIVSES